MKTKLLILFMIAGCLSCNDMQQKDQTKKVPIIIAHRGAQSIYPEHTIEGYQKAIDVGADYIEPDLVLTKDGIFVARHEQYISTTTNVADVEKFAHRKTTKLLDGVSVTDWFVSDFTLAELKTLRARQSWDNRPHNYDDVLEIPTFAEIITLAQSNKTATGKAVGIYPELKHPTFHKNAGLPMEDLFLEQIEKAGYTDANAPMYVQCFEVATLQYLNKKSSVKLVQLIGAAGVGEDGRLLFTKPDGSFDPEGQPYDFIVNGDTRSSQFFTTQEGMEFIATYADGVGPWKPFIISFKTDPSGTLQLLPATDFITLAHQSGLEVHPYTFRNEDLKWTTNTDPATEYALFFNAGVDGIFSDYTLEAVKAREQFFKRF